ncbi:MAG TPA: hypothetical protein VJC17_04725 [Candidatus Dojkabacteria bacterium]|nr:hypothetical protein [Candidatus Dojkabacteria bacterium]
MDPIPAEITNKLPYLLLPCIFAIGGAGLGLRLGGFIDHWGVDPNEHYRMPIGKAGIICATAFALIGLVGGWYIISGVIY